MLNQWGCCYAERAFRGLVFNFSFFVQLSTDSRIKMPIIYMQKCVYEAPCWRCLSEPTAEHYVNKGTRQESKEEGATCAAAQKHPFICLSWSCLCVCVRVSTHRLNSGCLSAPLMTTSLTPACSYLSVDGPILKVLH